MGFADYVAFDFGDVSLEMSNGSSCLLIKNKKVDRPGGLLATSERFL